MSGDGELNVLWFCTDQQRWDTIGALGNPYVRTPTLDALCAAGTAFTRAYCQSPICTPSRASFLTGRYPASHHVYRNGNSSFPAGEVLVSKVFADAGYDCGLIGKLHLATASQGVEPRVEDGYSVFQWSLAPRPEDGNSASNAYHDWLRAKGADPVEVYKGVDGFLGPGAPASLSQVAWLSESTEAFIRDRRDRPWFLSLNPFPPHHPFTPPPEYLAEFNPEALPHPLFRPSDLTRQERFRAIQHQSIDAIDPTQPDPGGEAAHVRLDGDWRRSLIPPPHYYGRSVKAAYYAMIAELDAALGRILKVLDETGQRDRTLIVFASDHGEMLGDHGLLYKGCRFFDGAVRVPLIFACPRLVQPGVVSDALVELVDIAPTLLEAAGLAVPSAMQGRSLRPIITGSAEPHRHKEIVVCDFNGSLNYCPVPERTQATMTFDGRYKLVVYHRHNLYELFDHAVDPEEYQNFWDDPAYAVRRTDILGRHLDAMMATVSPGPDTIRYA